jgi:hypothetical protein
VRRADFSRRLRRSRERRALCAAGCQRRRRGARLPLFAVRVRAAPPPRRPHTAAETLAGPIDPLRGTPWLRPPSTSGSW